MPGIVTAWLVGEGLIFYRSWKQNSSLPPPGQLLAASAIFVMLGILADTGPSASKLATTLAWGFDIAAFMNLAPSISTGGTTDGTGPSAGTTTHEPAGPPARTGTGGRTT
jgi:hypothetical protein